MGRRPSHLDPSWARSPTEKIYLNRISNDKKVRIMCGGVEMNKEAEWAKTAPYCEFHPPT